VQLPTAHTDVTLAQYMADELGDFATLLGWAVAEDGAGDFRPAVHDTLRGYGAANVATATDVARLEALASAAVWSRAARASAHLHAASTDGSSWNPQQAHEHAVAMAQEAARAALPYVASYGLHQQRIVHRNDPYTYLTDEERSRL
jgi:hypothetical protein